MGEKVNHKCLNDSTKEFEIMEWFDFTEEGESGDYILILKHNNNIYFLFPWGDNIGLNNLEIPRKFSDSEFTDKIINSILLKRIIDKINYYYNNNNLNLYLYGHSMGSIYINYLLSRVNEINFNNIVVRMTGTFIGEKEFIILSVNKDIDYLSLNLGKIENNNNYYIDRYSNIKNINPKYKEHTLIGIEANNSILIKKITSLESTDIVLKGSDKRYLNNNNKDILHDLDYIYKFIQK